MVEKQLHEIFVGTETGTLKHHISFSDKFKDLKDVNSISKGDEIIQMSWLENEERILIGLRKGDINVYDLKDESFFDSNVNVGNDTLIGLSHLDSTIITAVETGIVKFWNTKSDPVEIIAGTNLSKMRHNPYVTNNLATGGKENPLKVWDINTLKCVFTAKNLPNDFLQLRVPIWVSDMVFLSENIIAAASRYNKVSLYDIRTQRRPVVCLEVKDATYSTITVTCKENTVIVGGGKGLMNMIDLKKPSKVIHKYKGFMGAIEDIKCDKNVPLIFSVSLDRKLRVHDLNTTALLQENYLKSRLNCLLIKEYVKKDHVNADTVTEIKNSSKDDFESDPGDTIIENANIYQDDSDNEQQVSESKSNKRSKHNAGKQKKRRK